MPIGATTENPYFEVNSKLLSRSCASRAAGLSDDDVKALLWRALDDHERGIADLPPVDDDAIDFPWRRAPAATRAPRCPRWSWRPSSAST